MSQNNIRLLRPQDIKKMVFIEMDFYTIFKKVSTKLTHLSTIFLYPEINPMTHRVQTTNFP